MFEYEEGDDEFKLDFHEEEEEEKEEVEPVEADEPRSRRSNIFRRQERPGEPTMRSERLGQAPPINRRGGLTDILGTPGENAAPGRDVRPPLHQYAFNLPGAVQWRVWGELDGRSFALGAIDIKASEDELVKRFFTSMPKAGESKFFRLRALSSQGEELGEEVLYPISGDHIVLQQLRKPQTPDASRYDPVTGVASPVFSQDSGMKDIIGLARETVMNAERSLADERERARIAQQQAAAEQINYSHTALTTLQTTMERVANQEAERAERMAKQEAERARDYAKREEERARIALEAEQKRNEELRNTMAAQFSNSTTQQQMFFQQQQAAAEQRMREQELHYQKLQREEEARRSREQAEYDRKVAEEKRMSDLRLAEEKRIAEARLAEDRMRWERMQAQMKIEADARLAEIKAEAERRKEEEERKEDRRRQDEERKERLWKEEQDRKEAIRKEELENRRQEYERKERDLERKAAAEEAERTRKHEMLMREQEAKQKREEEHQKQLMALNIKTAEASAYRNGGGLKEAAVMALGFAKEVGLDVPGLIDGFLNREPPPPPPQTDWASVLSAIAPVMGTLAPVFEKALISRQTPLVSAPTVPPGYQLVPVTTVEEDDDEDDDLPPSVMAPRPVVARVPATQVAPVAAAPQLQEPGVINHANLPVEEVVAKPSGLPGTSQRDARLAIRNMVLALRQNTEDAWIEIIKRFWSQEPMIYYFVQQIGLRAALREVSNDEAYNSRIMGAVQSWTEAPTDLKYE